MHCEDLWPHEPFTPCQQVFHTHVWRWMHAANCHALLSTDMDSLYRMWWWHFDSLHIVRQSVRPLSSHQTISSNSRTISLHDLLTHAQYVDSSSQYSDQGEAAISAEARSSLCRMSKKKTPMWWTAAKMQYLLRHGHRLWADKLHDTPRS